MKVQVTIEGKEYALRLDAAHDLSIAVRFSGERLSAFGAPLPVKVALQAGDFIGDVARGGSCNCDTLSFTPHTSGTHTESIGHIAGMPMNICDVLKDSLIPATVISILPQSAPGSGESYDPAATQNDGLITREALEAALGNTQTAYMQALIIRTLPNGEDKKTRAYGDIMPPYFSLEAMEYIVRRGVRHLLVDMPSIDRLDDGGTLSNHHIFWEVARGKPVMHAENPSPKTVTELIYVPDAVADGQYVLNLQVAPLAVDGSPSRPLLYEMTAL